MTKPLRKFWLALDALPSPVASYAEWRQRLEDELPRAKLLLSLEDRISASVPVPGDPHSWYRVERRTSGDYFGINDRTGDHCSLPKEDVLVYRASVSKLASVICANLRLDPHIASAPVTAGLWQIGGFKPLAGYEFPVFLSLNLAPLDSRPVIEWLGLATEGPFILFGPTSRRLRPSDHALLKRRGACFIPLEDCLMISDANKMSLLPEAHQSLLHFQQLHVPVANDEPTIEFFPTPAGAKWSDLRLRFVDGETLSVSILRVDGRFIYSQMGFVNKKTARPNYQWELLRDFAQCGGKITWSDPAASAKLPKRKEALAKILKAFFRIDESPIELTACKKGWCCAFEVRAE